ncbi:MAG: hypothetical protein JW787_04080 [Sedimentisphaerales bacterium]|nr:hypothetical protein [Sedimentisphaerales bacterium]
MASTAYLDKQVTTIAALGRYELTKRIKNFKGRFKMDFSEEYLSKLSIERLRHILLAAQITAGTRN